MCAHSSIPSSQDQGIVGIVHLFGMILMGQGIVGRQQSFLSRYQFGLVGMVVWQCCHQIHQTGTAQILVFFPIRRDTP